MPSLDRFLANATSVVPERQQQRLPGCVLSAYKDGTTYQKAFGKMSIDIHSPTNTMPISFDTCMWAASCTKLMTAIAALQCVERGLLVLDGDIATVLPEWKKRDLLLGFDETTGDPILETIEDKMTLRMLLTHNSGLGYAFLDAKLAQFIRYKVDQGWIVESDLLCPDQPVPLLFRPGKSWTYGIGTDWAGRMIERVTGLSLGDFMSQNIWVPLGMSSTSFRILERPDIHARKAELTCRNADGILSPHPTPFFPEHIRTDHGGSGVYTCAQDFMKVLIACATSDPKLLTSASYDALCEPCLPELSAAKFQEVRAAMHEAVDSAAEKTEEIGIAIPAPARMSWALGGMISLDDVPGGRRAGSMSWGGLPNLSWVVDRATGTALFYASQLLPPGDVLTGQVVRQLEAEVYNRKFFEYAEAL